MHKLILTFVMRFVVSLHSDHSEIRFSDKVSIVHTGLKPVTPGFTYRRGCSVDLKMASCVCVYVVTG